MTCEDAQRLIHILKNIIETDYYMIPMPGEQNSIDLASVFSGSDRFKVLFNRCNTIRSNKYTLLLRYGKDHGLLRIDVNGPPHTNPDGTIVECPHIHVQTHEKGHWDAWAYDLPVVFGNTDEMTKTLKQFLEYCSVNNISSMEIYEQTQMG